MSGINSFTKRNTNSNFDQHQWNLNQKFLYSIESQNFSDVCNFLSQGAVPFDQNVINLAFQFAITTENCSLVEILLKNKNCKPQTKIIDRLFEYYSQIGNDPQLIYILQQHASSAVIAQQQRFHEKLKYENLLSTSSHYVIGPAEINSITELQKESNKPAKKRMFQTSTDRLTSMLTMQTTMNDKLIDAIKSNNKILVYSLLVLKDTLKPSQQTINDMFEYCIVNEFISMAEILMKYEINKQSINQIGYETALIAAIEEDLSDIASWLLNGTYGFFPNQTLIDEFYRIRLLNNSDRINRSNVLTILRVYVSIELLQEIAKNINNNSNTELTEEQTRERLRRRNQQHFSRDDPEIHTYSATGIEATEIEGRNIANNNKSNNRLTLNEAIKEYILANTMEATYNIEYINHQLIEMIEMNISDTRLQTEAIQKLSEILNRKSVSIIGRTLTYLQNTHHSDSTAMNIWIQGFLGESISMHSCNPGVVERCVTGLRGINDPKLALIFAQAEGPQLARQFLNGTFNIYEKRNAKNISLILFENNITLESSETQIRDVLMNYAINGVTSYNVELKNYLKDIKDVIEIVVDEFHNIMKPYLIALLYPNTQVEVKESSSANDIDLETDSDEEY